MKGIIKKLIEGNLIEILLMVPFISFGYIMIFMSTSNLWCANGIVNMLGYGLGIITGIGMVSVFTSIILESFTEK